VPKKSTAVESPSEPKQTVHLYDGEAKKFFGKMPGKKMNFNVSASLGTVGIDEWDKRPRATLTIHRIAAARVARRRGAKP